MSTRASCNFLYRHIRPFRVDYAIIPIITIAKVFSEKNWLNAIPITSCMLCSKIAKRIPVSTFMELPISGRIVSKYIERCIIRIALNILAIDQQAASLFLCCELTCRIISKQWPECVTGYVTGSPLTSSQKVFRTIFCSGFSGCFLINILTGLTHNTVYLMICLKKVDSLALVARKPHRFRPVPSLRPSAVHGHKTM